MNHVWVIECKTGNGDWYYFEAFPRRVDARLLVGWRRELGFQARVVKYVRAA